MIYPEKLRYKDTIGIVAPSNGIVKESKINALNKAKENLIKYGFIIDESKEVRKSIDGVSNNAQYRAEDLMKYIINKDINCIITATGGDFLNEILEYINFENILLNAKWIQGYSDTTALLYILTTGFDISTIYSHNAVGFGHEEMHESEINNIEILKGERIKQYSYNLFESPDEERIIGTENLNLSIKTCWKTTSNDNKLTIKGRIIGGCLDCLLNIVGTKFDYTEKFINKYEDEAIIWYFDVFDLTNEDILRGLWQLTNAGWFKNTTGIIFGRMVNEISYTGISLHEAINRGVNNNSISILTDVDVGHTSPKITFINGAIATIEYNDGKGSITFDLK